MSVPIAPVCPTFYPSGAIPITGEFVSTYMDRGFSVALSKQVLWFIRGNESAYHPIVQGLQRVACMPILFSFLPLSIIETTIRVAFMVLLFIPSFIPCCRDFYQREFVDLTFKSLSNCFVMFVMFPFLQLAIDNSEIKKSLARA